MELNSTFKSFILERREGCAGRTRAGGWSASDLFELGVCHGFADELSSALHPFSDLLFASSAGGRHTHMPELSALCTNDNAISGCTAQQHRAHGRGRQVISRNVRFCTKSKFRCHETHMRQTKNAPQKSSQSEIQEQRAALAGSPGVRIVHQVVLLHIEVSGRASMEWRSSERLYSRDTPVLRNLSDRGGRRLSYIHTLIHRAMRTVIHTVLRSVLRTDCPSCCPACCPRSPSSEPEIINS